MAPEPRVIAGRYQLFERLGKGAMGVVYRAHDSVLDRTVAVKMMVADMADDPRLRERFLKEARAAARLNHRHVVTIHELTEVDGEICIIMELLDGVDLATLMRQPVPLPLSAKLTIIDGVLDGLHYAHEQGVIHRDIKPGNLHLTSAGVAKILDFGIARLLSAQMTGTMSVVGTPAYMSPEQARGLDVDRRTDLFAVGAVFYELLSGARPFEADSIGRLMALIAETPHAPLGPDVPRDVARLVDRLLAKDRTGRPDTAAVARAELAEAMRVADTTDHDATRQISEMVRETVTARETIAPDVALPPTPRSAARAAGERASSGSGLTTFALQQSRALREQGDLGGAMRALRSVLEAEPGNDAALSELHLVEQELSGSGTKKPTGRFAGFGRPLAAVAAAVLLAAAAGPALRWMAGGGNGDRDLARQARAANQASAPVAEQSTLAVPAATPSDEPPTAGADPVSPRPSPPPDPPAPPAAVVPLVADPPTPDEGRGPGDQARRRSPPIGRGALQGGAAEIARERFDQLSRLADREGLDDETSEELASIRRAAEAATAAGNLDEAGAIYFQGVLLLEDAVPEGAETADRESRRGGRGVGGRAGEAGVRRAIDDYVRGIERGDRGAVRRVRTTLSSFEERLLSATEPVSIRFDELQIDVVGPDRARVSARQVVERTDVQPRRQEGRVQLVLTRNGGGDWRITSLQATPGPR